jgi:nitroreductase
MDKPAALDHSIFDLLRRRWSPRAFSAEPVGPALLRSLFEAARWAPSASNLQPWHFLLARREESEAFEAMLSCLVPFNQAWCRGAAALVLTVARMTTAEGKPNAHAWHDVGQAAAHLTFQAASLGLFVHQMAGIEPARIRETYRVPEGYEPVSAIALGYAGSPDQLDPRLKERERAPRSRRKQAEFVFAGAFGRPADS